MPVLDKTQTARSRTISIRGGLSVEEKRNAILLDDYDPQAERPKTRGECVDGPRPCPFVACRYHLYLDVDPRTGSLKLNFPHLEIEDLKESCALDVADRGGATLEEVGGITGLTRERIRQIEVRGLLTFKAKAGHDLAGD